MSDPLPPTPLWFARVGIEWEPFERFYGILGASVRRKQLERLKKAHKIEFVCRTYGPGVVKLYARLANTEQDQF